MDVLVTVRGGSVFLHVKFLGCLLVDASCLHPCHSHTLDWCSQALPLEGKTTMFVTIFGSCFEPKPH